MQITTEIDFELDVEDTMREIAQEVVEENHMTFQDDDDVQSMIDDSIGHFMDAEDVQNLIDESNQDVSDLITGLGDTDESVTMLAANINRIYKRLYYLENRELYSLRSRLGRLFRRLRDIHWYSPWIGPRR